MEQGPKDDALPGAGAMTTTTTNATMSGAEIVDLCRKHTIFEWSPQGAVDPIPVDGGEALNVTKFLTGPASAGARSAHWMGRRRTSRRPPDRGDSGLRDNVHSHDDGIA